MIKMKLKKPGLKGNKPTAQHRTMSREVAINNSHHVKVPINPKDMLKMHISHMIMKQIGLNS